MNTYHKIRAASLCSGIGAPEYAAPHWEWLWHSEIAPFPSAVLAIRHPGSVNLGDLTADNFAERAQEFGPIDVMIAGTPCQSFSIAGSRKGLADPRGNIMLQAINIYQKLCEYADRQGYSRPLFIWENVKGALSAEKGTAFGCLLGALAGYGATLSGQKGQVWGSAGVASGPEASIGWRVLNAEFFGLPQRRNRLFAICCPHSTQIDSTALLFEPGAMPVSPETQARLASHSLADAERTDRLKPFGIDSHSNLKGLIATHHVFPCLKASKIVEVCNGQRIRRITPIEAERCQGFPDNYTNILFNGTEARDAPRYHALGNSMPVPVLRWLFGRIEEVIHAQR
ncbi:DNA cytosine methyltransferase [Acetobacteraceae bacterium ESL0709]|nr:DNA cytosine methyltransferase [Acetobacteraceae bacterium ESL0697]MDF7677411.1 DNA cytosine methyltransferase [Acetobacteraceae bacterium ESL0709]